MSDAPEDDDLRDHYDFDFRQAKPNRFAAAFRPGGYHVSLEPEGKPRGSPEDLDSGSRPRSDPHAT